MIQFACVHVEKNVQHDDYKRGCSGRFTTILCERVNIVAESLPELFKAIGERYGLDIDDLWIPADEIGPDDDTTRVGFNRLETDDSSEPDKRELAQWKRGGLKLWLADYEFLIQRRIVAAISLDEIKAAGLKYHE